MLRKPAIRPSGGSVFERRVDHFPSGAPSSRPAADEGTERQEPTKHSKRVARSSGVIPSTMRCTIDDPRIREVFRELKRGFGCLPRDEFRDVCQFVSRRNRPKSAASCSRRGLDRRPRIANRCSTTPSVDPTRDDLSGHDSQRWTAHRRQKAAEATTGELRADTPGADRAPRGSRRVAAQPQTERPGHRVDRRALARVPPRRATEIVDGRVATLDGRSRAGDCVRRIGGVGIGGVGQDFRGSTRGRKFRHGPGEIQISLVAGRRFEPAVNNQ
jgi:hypothetical protein